MLLLPENQGRQHSGTTSELKHNMGLKPWPCSNDELALFFREMAGAHTFPKAILARLDSLWNIGQPCCCILGAYVDRERLSGLLGFYRSSFGLTV